MSIHQHDIPGEMSLRYYLVEMDRLLDGLFALDLLFDDLTPTLQDQPEGLLQILAGNLQGLALRVHAGYLLDEGDVSLGHLLENCRECLTHHGHLDIVRTDLNQDNRANWG